MIEINKSEEKNIMTRLYSYVITIILTLTLFVPGALFALEQNIDRPGSDYHHFPLASPNPDLCEKMCREGAPFPYPYATSRCKAFTYVKPTTSQPNGVCWLKEKIPAPVKNSYCVSGVVRQSICVHGNSGQIQNKNVDASHHGWGIDYDVAGKGSWLQYSIPTSEADTKIEGLELKFSIDNPKYGWLAAIHVYDGDKLLEKFDNQIYGSSLSSEKRKTVELSLPLSKPFKVNHGVGISILPQTEVSGGLAKIVNIEIHSVCVLVTTTP